MITKMNPLKKGILVSIMFTLALPFAKAQNPNNQVGKPPQIIPSSPQSQIFENYLNHAVTEYSGLPTIEIPLFELKLKDLTIPIKLSYHASGIRYMQYDGDIGAGWSIAASGYRVTRSVRGADDFGPKRTEFQSPLYNQNVRKQTDMNLLSDVRRRDNFLYFLSFNPDYPSYGGYPKGVLAGMPNNDAMYGDGQYDKFQYMLPTTSGSFIIKDRPTMQVALLDDKRDKVELQREQCKITDVNGIEYLIGGIDNGMELFEKEVTVFHETAWVLREIRTPSNETVNFRYKRIVTVNQRFKENISGATISDAPFYSFPAQKYGGPTAYPDHVENSLTLGYDYSGGPRYETLLFLDEIETNHMRIIFERGSILGMEHILKTITILDKISNKVIDKVEFSNSVFPFNINNQNQYKTKNSHILLNEVSTLGKSFSMDYYSPPASANNPYPDQWNYYNFKPYLVSNGQFFLHKEFLQDKVMGGKTYGASEPYIIGLVTTTVGEGSAIAAHFVDRSVDEENIMAYSLKKIHFPTGGSTEYIYETHETLYGKGGGLRVKKIKSNDLVGQPLITEFKYSNGISSFKMDHNFFASDSYSVNHDGDFAEIDHLISV